MSFDHTSWEVNSSSRQISMTIDELTHKIEAFVLNLPAPVTIQSDAKGVSLGLFDTGAKMVRIRPFNQDDVELLWWNGSRWKEIGDFGPFTLPINEVYEYLHQDPLQCFSLGVSAEYYRFWDYCCGMFTELFRRYTNLRNPDGNTQTCLLWRVDNPPNVLSVTDQYDDLCKRLDFEISEDDMILIHDKTLWEAINHLYILINSTR